MPDGAAEAVARYRVGDPLHPDNAAFDDVLRIADEALEQERASFELLEVSWHVRFLRGDYDGALRDLRRGRSLRPGSANVQYHLGLVHSCMDNGREALECFSLARSLAFAVGDEALIDAIDHHDQGSNPDRR